MGMLQWRLRSRFTMILVLLVALASLAVAPGAQAVCIGDTGPRALVDFRAGSEGQLVFEGYTLTNIANKITELTGQGWYLHTIDGYALGCDSNLLRYSAVFKAGTIEQLWAGNWKRADFEAENLRLRELGWRMVQIDTQMVNNALTYNAIWRKSTADQIEYFAWKPADFMAEQSRLWGLGWRINNFDTFSYKDGTRYYNAIFRPSTRDQAEFYGWSETNFINKYNELAGQGWRLYWVEGGSNGVYGAFTKSTVAERFWIGWNGGAAPNLVSKTNDMFNSGWRVSKLALTR